MAQIERLVPTNNLKTNILEQVSKSKIKPFIDYDSDADALMLLVVPPDNETVVHYVDDQVALLYLPETLEIVGVQIEAFLHSFVPHHENVQRLWQLSSTGVQMKSSDMVLIIKKPQVIREVAEATKDILGEPGQELAAMLA